jgi:SAM-dependent methyltransferase
VLDVGAGAGAASLPLAERSTKLTAVDSNDDMLTAFRERAQGLGVEHGEVLGGWPQVADSVITHDVVLAHHVVYNVPDIVPFLSALTDHARRRIVIELPPHHPLTWMAPLWKQFHNLDRPQKPLAGDIVEILGEMTVNNLRADYWARHDPVAGPSGKPENVAERAALVTKRLCLPESREADVAKVLADVDPGYHREVVTISWDGIGA